jgi:2-C-methyl-D-erythritol 2,4-cyclodiphosphate synthase
VGTGLDVHPFDPDPQRPLILAGVVVPGSAGLAGHSDADVVAHAVADALLGAAALGDLGSTFGVDDPALAGVSSLELLAETRRRAAAAGWAVGNVDLIVVAQRPRLAPYQQPMRTRLAEVLGVGPEAVSVKITSTDRLGTIGRGEGIACLASCLLVARA